MKRLPGSSRSNISPARSALTGGALLLLLAAGGCRRSPTSAVSPDPADANVAPVYASERAAVTAPAGPVEGPSYEVDAVRAAAPVQARQQAQGTPVNESQQAAEGYAAGQAPAPIERRAPATESSPADPGSVPQAGNPGPQDDVTDAAVQNGYDALDETQTAETAPPPLPAYDQPPAPAPNTIWTPGYWNYAPAGYFWVPGAWVAAPYAGRALDSRLLELRR